MISSGVVLPPTIGSDRLSGGLTDYVDLFLIHDPFGGRERRLEIYRALLEARNAGKIKSVGVSNL